VKLGSFGAFDSVDAPRPRHFRPVRGQIGFVWRISPAVGEGTRPNWVCLAESGGPLWVRTNPQSSDWLCFARLFPRSKLETPDFRLATLLEIGFVCTTSHGPRLPGRVRPSATLSPPRHWEFSLRPERLYDEVILLYKDASRRPRVDAKTQDSTEILGVEPAPAQAEAVGRRL
jgi:hypothetical protein